MEWEEWPGDIGFYRFVYRGPVVRFRYDPQENQEQLELARQAALSCQARQKEDIRQWAERIARDVGHLND